MQRLKFAVLGGWHIHTDRFIDRVNRYPECRVEQIWDPDEKRGRARAEQWGCRYEAHLAGIWRDREISGVLITSPLKEHFSLITEALRADKHVFVEKPAVRTVCEMEEIRELLRKTGKQFLVSDPVRSSIRQLKYARNVMDEGKIGKITTIRVRCAMGMANENDHLDSFNVEETGGGIMYDLGCHAVHMLYILKGMPQKAHAAFSSVSKAAEEYGVEDQAVALYEFEDGVLGIAETSALAERREDFFLISGTKGSIVCLNREIRVCHDGGEWEYIPEDQWPEENPYPLYDWIDRIRDGGKLFCCDSNDAAAFTGMIEGAVRASGQAVMLQGLHQEKKTGGEKCENI